MKEIVLPGEKVADGKQPIPNTVVEGDATYATVIGIKDKAGKYIALEARYKPHEGDTVVGIVMDVRHAGYSIDINMHLEAFVQARDLRVHLPLGSAIMARIRGIEGTDIRLSELRKLPSGKITEFSPAKVPRLIGKKSSMINMIKEKTGGEIIVGNNGYVWISENSDIPKVLKAVNMIEEKAHLSGLTDQVAGLLNK